MAKKNTASKRGLKKEQFMPSKEKLKEKTPLSNLNSILVVFLPLVFAIAYTLTYPYIAMGCWPENYSVYTLICCGVVLALSLLNNYFYKKGLYPKFLKPLYALTVLAMGLGIVFLYLDSM